VFLYLDRPELLGAALQRVQGGQAQA